MSCARWRWMDQLLPVLFIASGLCATDAIAGTPVQGHGDTRFGLHHARRNNHGFYPERGFKLRSRTGTNLTHDNHYLFGPSAIPMEGGTGYYQNQDILMHSAYYAPTDGFNIGAGLQVGSVITSRATGSSGPLFHVRMAASGELGNGVHAGGFVMGVRLGPQQELNGDVMLPSTLGLGAAQVTFGNDPVNVTASVGTTVSSDGFGKGPMYGLAALWHISEHVALITENWNFPLGTGEHTEQYKVYSYGARITHRTMAFDAAFAINEDLSEFFFLGVPVLGFSLKL